MKNHDADKRETSQGKRFSCARLWRECHDQARKDLSTRWRTGGLRFLVVIWLAGLCLSLTILSWLSSATSVNSLGVQRFVACQPNGAFDLHPENYRFWSSSGFFQITLGYGNLTFTQAKVIDVTWDIVCGRGGQAIVALVSWHVFAKYVTTSMKVAPVTFNTYRTIFLQNESLMIAVPRLLRDFTRRRGLHSKVAMVFMIATMIWIWIFPSFASAMTGYSANIKAYIQDADDNFISFDDFRRAMYVIHDGWRIGKPENYVIPYNTISDEPVTFTSESFMVDPWEMGCFVKYPNEGVENCRMQAATANYIVSHGFYGLENKTTTFRNITLPPPVLNISAFYLVNDFPGINWTDPRTQEQPFLNKSRRAWIHSNTTYSMEDINSRGACQATKTYQWGFSFIQLNIMLILCILWTVGISTMAMQTHFTMKQRGRTDVAGEYKAVLELADALNTQLLQAGETGPKDVLILPESSLRRRVTEHLNGGSIAYETPLLTSGNEEEGDAFFKSWLKKEVWWIALILISLGGFFCSCLLLSWILVGFPTAVLLTVCFGTTGKSRAVLLFWSLAALCLLPVALFTSFLVM